MDITFSVHLKDLHQVRQQSQINVKENYRRQLRMDNSQKHSHIGRAIQSDKQTKEHKTEN